MANRIRSGNTILTRKVVVGNSRSDKRDKPFITASNNVIFTKFKRQNQQTTSTFCSHDDSEENRNTPLKVETTDTYFDLYFDELVPICIGNNEFKTKAEAIKHFMSDDESDDVVTNPKNIDKYIKVATIVYAISINNTFMASLRNFMDKIKNDDDDMFKILPFEKIKVYKEFLKLNSQKFIAIGKNKHIEWRCGCSGKNVIGDNRNILGEVITNAHTILKHYNIIVKINNKMANIINNTRNNDLNYFSEYVTPLDVILSGEINDLSE